MAKNILIAEDEKPMAKALELKLTKEGFNVSVAYDGEEALNLIAKKKFDLMLLDIMMPKVDGFSVLTKLNEEKLKLPVIVSSNLSQVEDIERAKSLGAVDFLVKSNVTLAEIIQKIKAILKI
jgi:DNA-binding response OmpR family regulator